jgi:hypothetical protein
MAVRWRRFVVWSAWLLAAWSCAATADSSAFQRRLSALGAAVDAELAASPDPRPPQAWRKVLWLQLAGDQLPDALVVLRWRRDECAVSATSARPCRALLFSARDDGSFGLVTDLTLRVHPVALRRAPGGIHELYYARDVGAQPTFAAYGLEAGRFTRLDRDLTLDQLRSLPVLLADDRSMPAWDDQTYAAAQFPNAEARLAPFRLHFDAVTVAATRVEDYNAASDLYDAQFEPRSQVLLEGLLPDARALAAALPWSQTLELRLWSCVDWMVERRFWEVESRRLGRLGACVEPALYAWQNRIVTAADATDLARLPLLLQVGMAYLLRVAPLPLSERDALRAGGGAEEARFRAAVAGQWLGHRLRLMGTDRGAAALAALERVAVSWFEAIERDKMRFVSPTPELRAYAASMRLAMQAHQCLRKALGQAPAKAFAKIACDAGMLGLTQATIALLHEDLKL